MIFVTQWLCEARHCAVAAAWDDRESAAADVEAEGAVAFTQSGGLNPWCGICGGALRVEHGRTRFADLAEAQAAMLRLQQDQFATRAYLDAIGLTVDAQKDAAR